MADDTAITNYALRLLKAQRITSLTDGSNNANAANDVFTQVRDELIRAHNWNFATKRQKLAQSSTTPTFEFDNAYPLPASVRDDVAAILDPLGNAAHTALSFDLVGEDVLITGAGPIGIMATAICRHVGARFVVITDVNDYRLELARRMGADHAVNVGREGLDDTMAALGMTEGFDVGLEMSGNPEALRDLLRVMNHGGRVALLGLLPRAAAIDWDQVIFKGLVLKGIYGREMFETWYKMTSMLRSGLDVTPVLTHHFPIDDFADGFEVMRSGRSGKVILEWG